MKLLFHGFNGLNLIVLNLILLKSVSGFYENQPKFISEDGNLIIESALNRNISFRTKGLGNVNVNDFNLLNALQSSGNSNQPSFQRNALLRRLSGRVRILEGVLNGRNGLRQRLQRLENGTNANDGPTNSRRQFNARLQRLEDKVELILRKLTEDNCRSFPCQNGGKCVSRYDGYTCQCLPNWEGETCGRDVNECAHFAGTDLGCQNGATCINTQGSYNCMCRSGWQGLHCTRNAVDCLSGNAGDLCGHGTCVQTSTAIGYSCICEQGWTTNSVSPACTVDVNECMDDKPHCSKDPEVTCINLPGSFMCGSCPSGFTGNGFYCTDVNECATNNGGCSTAPSVPCINERGSYRCGACPSGYEGNGRSCTRTGNTCSRPDFCHPQARCVEYANSVVLCICPEGYTGNGFGSNGCTRTDGCTPNPCLNGGTCIVNGSEWTCQCPAQTVPPNCARISDLCSPNPCLNGGTCRQVSNRRICSCANGFLGANCQTEPRACGGRLKSPTGILKYPLEGAAYQHNARCAWIIETNITQILNITFTQFNVENSRDCRFDWLQIHDGKSSASYMIGRFCGTTLPNGGNIMSTHNMLYLWFRSDNSTSHTGFTLDWKSIDPVCGGTIETSSFGTISSPGSPGNYPPNRDCVWMLLAPGGKRIQLHFYTMRLETHNTCDNDYLSIHSGNTVEDVLLQKFCNTSQPEPLLTPSNEVTLKFHSDGDSTDTGFQIHYSVVEGIPGCGGVFTNPNGEFGSPMLNGQYQHNVVCDYVIQMPVNVRINIEFREFHVEEHSDCRFDYVAIYEGKTDQDPIVNKYCGKVIPPSYTSLSNILMIKFKSDWSTAHSGFRIYYTNVCGGTYTDEEGIVTSPNYPIAYESERTCQYYIQAPIGQGIILDFIDLEIEGSTNCTYDYVEAFDGVRSNVSSIGKFCGDENPGRIVSSYNYLYLEFVTDTSINGRGFKANYSFFDSSCGGILKTSDVVIRPPVGNNDDDSYAHESLCKWLIVAPVGKVIQVTWITFDIEAGSSCSYDYIEIYDNSTNFGGKIGRYCGRTHPPTFTSTDNMVTIVFKSDGSRNAGGFSATFSFIDASKSCGGRFYSTTGSIRSPGYPESYMHSKTCEWIITVPNGQQIELVPKVFDVELHHDCRFDYLEIRNGGNERSPLYGKFCGTTIPDHLTSFSNQMYLKFVSDHSQSHKGFEIEWDGSATGCGGILSSHRGIITSPNYPDPYAESTICVWKISVNLGSNIQIVISDLEMESTSRCTYDYLEIFDGRDSFSPSLGKFCTDNHPLHIESTGNHMYLRMQTDESDQGRGFNLRYNTLCKKELTDHMGAIESLNFPGNYPTMLDCEWTIRATKGNKIYMEFSHFEIENSNIFTDGEHSCNFDYVEIKQVQDGTDMSSKKYCNHAPKNFTSEFDVIVVKFVTDSSGSGSGFRLEWKVEGCGDIMTRPYGTFTSPNYPKNYPKNTHCEWTIKADYGYSVELTISDFTMESSDNCRYDGLFISNGKNDSQVLASLCHVNTKPTKVTSQGNELFIKFYSDISVTAKGFSAFYRFVESKCGSILTIPSGFIYSKNYPKNYESNSICEWLIRVENNHLIELNIMDFDIEGSDDCKHDKLKIYDGAESIEEKLLITHCGNQLPNVTKYLSSGNEMLVIFNSDDSVEAKGFKLNYTVACGSRILANDTGILSLGEHLKQHLTNCTWIIESETPSQHVTLTITHLDIFKDEDESNEEDKCNGVLEIYDGDSLSAPKKGRFCGIKNPTPIISSGQFLTVNLATNRPYLSTLRAMHFTAHYSVYDNACGGTFTSEHGVFASPHYPKSYPLNVECVWNIKATPGSKIGISLQSIDIPFSDNCHDSYLEIREVKNDGKLVGIYCGPTASMNLTSASGFWVKFRSGSIGTAQGFIADYYYDRHVELTGVSGQITSPLYPQTLYGRNSQYSWRVSVEYGSVIVLTFKEFDYDANCGSNFQIYDGYDENAPELVEEFCAQENLDTLTSSSNVLYIGNLQGRSYRGNRFSLNWVRVDKSISISKNETDPICGNRTIYLTELNTGVNFTSPGYPNGYATNINCSWIIMSNYTTYHPSLIMRDIDLETMDNCVADYIEIFTSTDLSTWTKLAKRCSYNREDENVFNGSPYLRIDFRSDYSANGTGFSGALNLICGSTLQGPNGIIAIKANDTITNRFAMPGNACAWNITVRRGRTIKFTFETMVLPMSNDRCMSSIVLRNGIDEESPLLGLGKYCGTTISEVNQTSGHRGFVKYNLGSDRRSQFVLRYQEMTQECGGNIILTKSMNYTIITSPNYPNVPFAHSECVWVVMASGGENLKFEFLENFDIRYSRDCAYEYVEMRDGSTNGARIIGTYCALKPSPQTTNNNILRIKFFTDVLVPNNGFKVKVSIALCGGVYRSPKGLVSSPNFPNIGGYPLNTECEFHIIGRRGSSLNITFISIDLPEGNCSNSNYVQILSFLPIEYPNITEVDLGKFCGSEVPASIMADGNEVKIKFKILNSPLYRGFQLSYNSSNEDCSAELISESGIITSSGYPTARQIKRFCVWTIEVPKGRRIRVDFDDLDLIQTDDSYTQRIGFYNDHKQMNKIKFLKGGETLQPIYTSENKLMINMWVRVPSNHRGFKLRYSSNESTICVGDLSQTEGTISGPLYYKEYVCSYSRNPISSINPIPGTIALEFTDMIIGNTTQTVCTYASTRVAVFMDQKMNNKNMIAAFCGNHTRTATVRSPFPNTNIEAVQGTYYGNVTFNLVYKVHNCGGVIYSQNEESIKQSNFTENYGKVDCAWQINYNKGQIINLEFKTFNLKQACDKEFINVYEGPSSRNFKIGTYCVSSLPETLNSHSHVVFVEYHSDSYSRESNFEIITKTSNSACGGLLNRRNSIIQSPLINSQYPNNIECIWTIQSSSGYHIGLYFTGRFFLEKSDNCSKDYIEISEPEKNGWKNLGRVCGRDMPPFFNSTGTKMKIVFRTDGAITGDGFNAIWEENCGGTFNATNDAQLISSPGYPGKYGKSLKCNYTILAPENQFISLTFLDFDLENRARDCSFDNVTIYKSHEYSDEMEISGTYCKDKPAPLRAKNQVNVVFITDRWVERNGFQFEYKLDHCGGIVTESSLIESPKLVGTDAYPTHLTCYWNITAPVGKKITIRFEKLHLEHNEHCYYDYLEVFSGSDVSEDKRLAKVCGNMTLHPPSINVDSNLAVLHLRTDSSNNFGGFSALIIFSEMCNKNIELTSATPNYDLNEIKTAYAPLLDCHYLITAPIDRFIKVSFQQFHLAACDSNHNKTGCACDFLEIRDGEGPFGDLIGRYCGQTLPKAVTSSGPTLWMRFSTDATTSSTGFLASLSLHDSVCGQHNIAMTKEHTKIIQSPGDEKYLPNIRCSWLLTADEYEQIEIDFEKLDLQAADNSGHCSNDVLEIADNNVKSYISEGLGKDLIFSGKSDTIRTSFYSGIRSAVTHNQYCGNGTPNAFMSSSNKVHIKFQTDSDIEQTGFKLVARVLQSCGRNYTSSQGRIVSTDAKECTFWITAPENYTISLYFLNVGFSESNCNRDGLKIYENGPNGNLIGSFCGYAVPDPVFATTRSIYVQVQKQASNHGSFDFSYLASDKGPGCGGQIFNYGGIFTSPQYPRNDRNFSDCRWDISVPQNLRVTLKFSTFDLGSDKTCDTNLVQIIEIDINTQVETVVRTYCGGDTPALYKGNRNVLSVRFLKTVNFSGTGFLAHFMGAHEESEVSDY